MIIYLICSPVPDGDLVSRFEEVGHHAGAHDAESQEADLQRGWNDVLFGRPGYRGLYGIER